MRIITQSENRPLIDLHFVLTANPDKYLRRIGIPSMAYNWFDRKVMQKLDFINCEKFYFSMPWERIADYLGQPNRSPEYYAFDNSGILSVIYGLLTEVLP